MIRRGKGGKARAAEPLAKSYRSSQQNRGTGVSGRRRAPVISAPRPVYLQPPCYWTSRSPKVLKIYLPIGTIAPSFQRVPMFSFQGNAAKDFFPDWPLLFGQGIRVLVREPAAAINTFSERLGYWTGGDWLLTMGGAVR